MSALFRLTKRFATRITPAITPTRDMTYIRFASESILECTSRKHLNVLDVGGGSGYQAHLLTKMLKQQGYDSLSIVLDYNREVIDKGKQLHKDVCFVRGEGHYLPFRSNVFHLLYSCSLLEHLQIPRLAISEQVRVCQTIICVQIPNLQYFIEPHSKAPLLSFFPETVRKKVVEITKAIYYSRCLNFNVICKKVINWFHNADAKLVRSSKVYHIKWTRILLLPQGYLLLFYKTPFRKMRAQIQAVYANNSRAYLNESLTTFFVRAATVLFSSLTKRPPLSENRDNLWVSSYSGLSKVNGNRMARV